MGLKSTLHRTHSGNKYFWKALIGALQKLVVKIVLVILVVLQKVLNIACLSVVYIKPRNMQY